MRYWALTILAGAVVTGAGAQDAKSGIQPGKDFPASFHPYNATGSSAGRFHCLVSEHGLNPVAAVFARNIDDVSNAGFVALMQSLDALAVKNGAARLGCYIVFVADDVNVVLTDDDKRNALASKLQDVGKAAGLQKTVLAITSPDDVKDFGLSDQAGVTAVLYDRLKVKAVHAVPLDKLNEAAVKKLVEEVSATLLPKK